jgi:hypothetical protein
VISRPAEPSVRGPWSAQQIASFLDGAVIPLRLAVVARDRTPLVLSLWYLRREGCLWSATSARARVVAHLEREGRCGFEVAPDAPPYRGVRGAGRVTLHEAGARELLRDLLRRYQGRDDGPLGRWLLGRRTPELAIRIEPTRLASWDYSARMA